MGKLHNHACNSLFSGILLICTACSADINKQSVVTDIDCTNTQQLIIDGDIDITEFLRADVNGDGIVNSTDLSLMQDYIDKAILSFPVGSTFSRMRLMVENLLNPLDVEADIPADCCTQFETTPFSCIGWKIEYYATWNEDLLIAEDLRRLLCTTFTEPVSENNEKGNKKPDRRLQHPALPPDRSREAVRFYLFEQFGGEMPSKLRITHRTEGRKAL